ncbi:hypothetical protein MHY01S_26060 [Meiothermus hypogaeus NBRC 106114]|uniref:Uncharacterized protein n=1 Tax=Meiothermus hypogaeus NBRC 106114 TaxID=1227553 RepID=A0A511R4A4_9DEIN|nr:hypothetical protein MHY01S_26060 [Meiothermus hypogaeus NBRC 106114]
MQQSIHSKNNNQNTNTPKRAGIVKEGTPPVIPSHKLSEDWASSKSKNEQDKIRENSHWYGGNTNLYQTGISQ